MVLKMEDMGAFLNFIMPDFKNLYSLWKNSHLETLPKGEMGRT